MKYEAQCEFCGNKFYPKRSSGRFCTPNCRVKNHQSKKQEIEMVQVNQTSSQELDQEEKQEIQQEIQRLKVLGSEYLEFWEDADQVIANTESETQFIKENLRLHELKISEYNGEQTRLQAKIASGLKELDRLRKEKNNPDNALYNFERSVQIKSLSKKLDKLQNQIETLFNRISWRNQQIIYANSDLEEEKGMLKKANDSLELYNDRYQKNHEEIEKLTKQLNQRKNAAVIPIYSARNVPRKVNPKITPSLDEIGAGDLQSMDFETFRLRGELGRFLGELDWNKTCIALTGDSGAGKTYFSFELAALLIAELGLDIKYFSLEEGIGKLTKEKVAEYGLGNELKITAVGNLEAVRKAAKEYRIIIVDSFTKLDAKTEDFENLRNDFPKTIFILIFQKTTSGSIRGGSAIKYNSSATIDVIKRDGERIAIMEKGRYGTQGWEYSISEGEIVKS